MSDCKDKPEGLPETSVPKAVVARLSLYLRELQHLVRDGHETTSSTQLGKVLGFTDAQVRKDLAYFGQFGYPGIGYRCGELIEQIKKIMGTNRTWPVALVGAGNLGRALLGYGGFQQQGFEVKAAFDVDKAKQGSNIDGIQIYPLADLPEMVLQHRLRLAILAVPPEAAQEAADQVIDTGIKGILNFAPVTISVPDHVHIVAVDLAIELEQLLFAVVNQEQNP